MASVSLCALAFSRDNAAPVPKDLWCVRLIPRPGTSVLSVFRPSTVPQITPAAARVEAKAAKEANREDVETLAAEAVVLEVAAAMEAAIGTATRGGTGGDSDLHRRVHLARDTCMM